jgi:hypothetical protein
MNRDRCMTNRGIVHRVLYHNEHVWKPNEREMRIKNKDTSMTNRDRIITNRDRSYIIGVGA